MIKTKDEYNKWKAYQPQDKKLPPYDKWKWEVEEDEPDVNGEFYECSLCGNHVQSQYKTIHASLHIDVKPLMTRAEWEEQAKKEGWVKSPIKPDTKSIYAPTIEDDTRVFMTGQAWFDRFKEELNKDMIANQPSNITEDPIRIIEAAKRASGVS